MFKIKNLLKKRKNHIFLTTHEGEFRKLFQLTDDKIKDSLNASNITNSILIINYSSL